MPTIEVFAENLDLSFDNIFTFLFRFLMYFKVEHSAL